MRSQNGFTLMEVLVSLTILAIGILGVLILLNGSLKMVQEAQDTIESGIFISSLFSLINNQNPANLSPAQFAGITYNDQPVIISFSKMDSNSILTKVNIVLKMKNGSERSFVMYVSIK